MVEDAGTGPSVRAAVDALVAVLRPHSIDLGCDCPDGLVPIDLDEILAAASGGWDGPLLQPTAPDGRSQNTSAMVGSTDDAGEQWRRVRIAGVRDLSTTLSSTTRMP